MSFRFPGGDQRTTVLGASGSGKTTNGLWLLAHQRLDKRPWICVDFKRETLFDRVGFPPLRELELTDNPPRKPGLYVLSPRPGQDEMVEAFLWKIWERENTGVYIDEAALMPDGDAFRALLQQGRSKRIPVIACSQRPVSVPRPLFSEASYFCIYRFADKRDYKTVEGFVPGDLGRSMPPFHWLWYDVARNELLRMSPVPRPELVADQLAESLPRRDTWHPFSWTSRPTDRDKVKI